MVGLTLRGPPTCRHRRDRGQKKKCRLLIFEVREVGRPRRRAQSMWAKNRSNESWDIQAWTIQAAGDKSAGRGGPALPGGSGVSEVLVLLVKIATTSSQSLI